MIIQVDDDPFIEDFGAKKLGVRAKYGRDEIVIVVDRDAAKAVTKLLGDRDDSPMARARLYEQAANHHLESEGLSEPGIIYVHAHDVPDKFDPTIMEER